MNAQLPINSRDIVDCPSILSGEWMLIGRQEKTGFGGIIDLLAITPDSPPNNAGSWRKWSN
jgi:hypothetical protein